MRINYILCFFIFLFIFFGHMLTIQAELVIQSHVKKMAEMNNEYE